MVGVSGKAAFIAIFIAQVPVMTTLHIARTRGAWQNRRSAGFAVFLLETVCVFVSLLVADWIS
jgi:hypothetical protein